MSMQLTLFDLPEQRIYFWNNSYYSIIKSKYFYNGFEVSKELFSHVYSNYNLYYPII